MPHVLEHGLDTCRRSACIAVLALLARAAVAHATPVAVGGGFDYYADSNDRVTRAGLAIGVLDIGAADVSIAAVRFDTNVIGAGNGITGAVGFPIVPLVRLRCTGARFVGDGDYRAWRVKVGPQLNAPAARVGVYYSHEDDASAPRTDGVTAEADVPLPHGFGARGTAGYARHPEGDGGALGSIGASCSVLRRVSLAAEIGMSRNVTLGSVSVPEPHRPTDGLPLIGGSSSSTTTTTTTARRVTSLVLGARVSFP